MRRLAMKRPAGASGNQPSGFHKSSQPLSFGKQHLKVIGIFKRSFVLEIPL
jgi:hypothetical protein